MTIAASATFATPRRLAGQGALLFMGFGASQGLSFVRNAIMGHALSKDNFGIAATITLILQMIETLSDLGADRLIVQAEDGDQPGFLASAHTLLAARGLLLGCILFVAGPLLAQFFGAGHAATAFQLASLVPAIKGFVHLDYRVAQRRFDNRPQMLVEVLPQLVALLIVLPVLAATRDYTAAVSLSLAQAVAVVVLSHVMAKGTYALGFDSVILKRQLAFGWPILASSLPLIAVYQGDRLIIGHLSGMEALASYTVAFMVTMVPGLIAAKVGHALMLPVFSDTLRRGKSLLPKFKIATEGTVVFAALYLAGFVVCGEQLLPLVFGRHYANLGSVTAWLAAMWALRMIQAVPGMALMAHGETKPFFVAGVLRALALPCVLWAATHGASIATLAAIGFAFEGLSLAYVTLRLEKLESGLGTTLFMRAAFLVPAALVAVLTASATQATPAAIAILSAGAVVLAIGASGLTIMPSLNAVLRRALQSRTIAAVI